MAFPVYPAIANACRYCALERFGRSKRPLQGHPVFAGSSDFPDRLLTLSQYLFGWDLHVDQWLFRDSANAYNIAPGRMSPFSTWTFVMLGMGLAALRCPVICGTPQSW